MTTKGCRPGASLPHGHRWKPYATGRSHEMSRTQVVLLVISCLLVAYTQGSKVATGSRGAKSHSCQLEPLDDAESNAVGFPGAEEEEKEPETDDPQPVTTTGQRVAGHLLAVLLLASAVAAIIEVVRARMSQCKSPHKAGDASGAASDPHHASSSAHGATGRTPRRAALQEKSHSQDSHFPRARSSSAGVTSHQEGTVAAAAAALAASRAQKALRTRLLGGRPLALGGRATGTPPLLRRSSFPVMTRVGSGSGRETNSGSPGMGTRKPSVSDLPDDEMGDFQKRRVRIIRRF